MKTITLNENEIAELSELYLSEIDRAQRRITYLKSILRKLSEEKSEKDSKSKLSKKSERRSKGKKEIVKPFDKNEDKTEILQKPLKGTKRALKKRVKKNQPGKRGPKPKSLLRKPIKLGKGKNKIKWYDFINNTIKEKNSLLLASSITHAALEKFQIPDSDRDRVRMAISTTLTKMTKSKVINTYSKEGIRGSFYGLSGWFGKNGELSKEYQSRLM